MKMQGNIRLQVCQTFGYYSTHLKLSVGLFLYMLACWLQQEQSTRFKQCNLAAKQKVSAPEILVIIPNYTRKLCEHDYGKYSRLKLNHKGSL